MTTEKKQLIDKVVQPVQQFMHQEKSGGVVLGLSVVLAMILANSPWSSSYFHFFEHAFGFIFDGQPFFTFSLHHWINDGLMAVFFFVIGLELKREILAGELSNFRKSLLPIGAAVGGMVVPALLFSTLNMGSAGQSGWGIPMATDIAFALSVLYLLGNRIPSSLKVFLTALAIVDDLGAVLVIAFFYSSNISLLNVSIGLACVLIMFIGNKMGIRNFIFYALFGILGVWASFLLSGVHATIASVLAAFTIPVDVRLSKTSYATKLKERAEKLLTSSDETDRRMLTEQRIHLLSAIKGDTDKVMPPLQRLETMLHPFVTYCVLPVFAFANAGIALNMDFTQLTSSHVMIGVALGLLIGKVVGIVGFTLLLVKLKVSSFPMGMTRRNLIGVGFLGAIGFTMSMFITSLAFDNDVYVVQAKIGILLASLLGGIIGYTILTRTK